MENVSYYLVTISPGRVVTYKYGSINDIMLAIAEKCYSEVIRLIAFVGDIEVFDAKTESIRLWEPSHTLKMFEYTKREWKNRIEKSV